MINHFIKNHYIKNFYKKISIKTKLMVIAIVFIIYPIIILGYFGYRNYSDVMKDKAISDSQSTARDLSSMLSERIQKLNLFSIQIFYDGQIYSAYNDLYSGEMYSFAQNDFQQYLQSKLFSKYELSEMLIRFSGSEKVFEASKTFAEHTDSFLNLENIYQCALKGKGKPTWYVDQKDGKVSGLYITKIIYSINDIKKEIGLLVLKVDERYIYEIFDNIISRQKQNVSILSIDGKEIFSHESFKGIFDLQLRDFVNSYKTTGFKEMAIESDTVYMLYDTVSPVDWKLVIGISDDVLFKEVRNISRLILLLCIATLPICFILLNYLYNDIIRPMNLLIKKMRNIQKGEIGVVIESNRHDEFGYVYSTFNKMSLNIKNLINTVYKKQIAMKDAEIKALQAQIDPHFLYNTLEAINWKARINGVDEICDMVSALSSIIDANLDRKNEKFIPIYKEMDYINNYTFLIQKRFGKKITFNLHVDKETVNHVIPKLIVQPIIENAIRHGLEMKKGGGNIDISINKEDENLIITVCDNGLGIDEELLNKIKEDMKDDTYMDDPQATVKSSKIGILNVHRRIKLLYGEDYGLEISSEANSGTRVMIKLPLNTPKGSDQNV